MKKKLIVTYPFHTVSRCDLSEHLVVAQNRDVCGVGELGVVSSGAKVFFAGGLRDGVKSCGG